MTTVALGPAQGSIRWAAFSSEPGCMSTITHHPDPDPIEHDLREAVPLVVALVILLGLVVGLAWGASQLVSVLGWLVPAR